MPTGSATWTSSLNIKQNVTLQGAAAESTIIVDDVSQRRGKEARDCGKVPRVSTKQSVRKAPRRKINPAKRQNMKPQGFGRQRAALIY